MPVRYSSDKEEHMAVRKKAGLFDVSHMGEFVVSGEKALELIQLISSNDASNLPVGKVQYACMPNHEGGIVDDFVIYRMAEDEFFLVVNAANIEKDWNWISASNVAVGADLKNVTDEYGLFALQGPLAVQVIESTTGQDLSDMNYYSWTKINLFGVNDLLISTTGYTGSGGFEIYVPVDDAVTIWKGLLEAGADFGLQPIGLGARDTLRLEKGFCLYGNDITDTTSPLEAGLGWVTKTTKHCNGMDKIEELKKSGVSRKLVGFKLLDKGLPRHGYKLFKGGSEIGEVTSGSLSPVLNVGIGLGYVSVSESQLGNIIEVQVRNKYLKAEVVKMPFV
jgi:aminomethyltransferase